MRRLREPANGLTHLAGALLAVGALAALVRLAVGAGTLRHLVACAVFGLSLVGLYTASALYHLLPLSARGVARLRRLDHVMIFALIAGTYTPFCLLALGGGWRWGLLALIWGLALGGMLLKLRWMRAPVWLSTALYVLLGWAALLAAPAFLRALPGRALGWVVAGGLIYTLGALIFALERPTPRRGAFGAHALWHLFVLAGSACHVWAVARYLTPLT
jgi:hemolysin III